MYCCIDPYILVFMSVAKENTYVSFYVIFLLRKGFLHRPSPIGLEEAGLNTSSSPLFIGTTVNHGEMYPYSRSPTAIIPVSSNMWLVLAAGRPPLSGST